MTLAMLVSTSSNWWESGVEFVIGGGGLERIACIEGEIVARDPCLGD